MIWQWNRVAAECNRRGPIATATEGQVWRSAKAERFSVIVDADRYFAIARAALLQAQSRIMLVGWDFDARITLGGDRGPDEPERVGEFLYWLVERNPALELYLLRWDVGALKSLFRGLTAFTLLKWMRHPRIHTKLDGHHPTGGSHHQKLVSIDDCFAFCGGIDMTGARWDTRDHRDDEPGRLTPAGRPYKPWHDATTALSGPAAAALGELCRSRWERATGTRLSPVTRPGDCWPDGLNADLTDVDIGVARTVPVMPDQQPVAEIEALFLAQIAAAQRYVYIESQYFASRKVAEAIGRRLQEPDGPEFVIVNPDRAEGWLQPLAMDTARARLMKALRQLDRHGRLAMYHPVTVSGAPIYVHAKIMVVDGRVVRVGSANLNNRSMRLDSECDVTVAAAGNDADRVAAMAADLRDGLLAEHLGRDIAEVRRVLATTRSLIATVEQLRDGGRSLRPYVLPDLGAAMKWMADSELLDPEGPEEAFEPLASRGLFRRRLHSPD